MACAQMPARIAAMADDLVARWNERYAERGYLWGIEPNRFLVEVAADLPPGRALDLGCGQGRNAVWLATLGHDVTGLDLSPVAIEHARRLASETGVDVEFDVVDLLAWDPGGRTWDLVVLSYVQLPADMRKIIHGKATDALAPGGRLIVIAHHLDNLTRGVGGPSSPDVLFTEEQLAADFPSLEILRCEQVLRPVETDDVSGVAVDVLVVAAKAS